MILQALTDYYEILAQQNKVGRPGWTDAKISYALYIDETGELKQVVNVKVEGTQGKKTVLLPQLISLPAPVKRTVGILSNFLWDNSSYILGVDAKGKPERSLKCFEDCRALHHQLLDGVDSPAARAILAFFDHWDPAQAASHPALQGEWADITASANLTFCLDTGWAHEDPLIRQAWQKHYDAAGEGPELACLVTGQVGPAEAVHPAIKGLAGAQSSGAALVSFNAPSFCSYGREQNFNAPVGKYASFAYTSALNYLLGSREHTLRVGDTTMVFWAKNGLGAYSFLYAASLGSPSLYSQAEIFQAIRDLCHGKKVTFNESQLDPSMDFYVLGLSPNAARMSVRFFLHNTFGALLQNISNHYARTDIAHPANDTAQMVSLWRMLNATVNQNSRDKSPSPELIGGTLRAILSDTPYPATLLNGVTLRIRAEQKIDRPRAAILKAYYTKLNETTNREIIPKEVLTVAVDLTCTDPAYLLGRLFSVLEAIQSAANPGINATIVDKYFNSASTNPATIFPTLIKLSQAHLTKLNRRDAGLAIFYRKQLGDIYDVLGAQLPQRLTLAQQGSFQLGYYQQTQARYQKKEEK